MPQILTVRKDRAEHALVHFPENVVDTVVRSSMRTFIIHTVAVAGGYTFVGTDLNCVRPATGCFLHEIG